MSDEDVTVIHGDDAAIIRYGELGGDEGYLLHKGDDIMSDGVYGTIGNAVDCFIFLSVNDEWDPD